LKIEDLLNRFALSFQLESIAFLWELCALCGEILADLDGLLTADSVREQAREAVKSMTDTLKPL
jgi:hypothetical protein